MNRILQQFYSANTPDVEQCRVFLAVIEPVFISTTGQQLHLGT